MIGRTLGRYHIVAKLGEGGMGSVWRAEDTVLGRVVALKLLAHRLASSEEARQRFIREARAASKLEHTSIATVHDVSEADGEIYIAYQFIEGRSLAARLTEGPLAVRDLLRFARLACEALAHAHERGVLHRDLTSGNLMLRPDGGPVIVDFGLARSQEDTTLTRTGTTLGTTLYLAPEQWRGGPGDVSSDLWSLGVVFYEAATGTAPFPGDTPEAVMFHVLNDEPVKPSKLRPELPPAFERVVLRMLEKDVRDRPMSAQELAAVLGSIERHEIEANAAPVPGESIGAGLARRWRRIARRRFKAVEIAVLLSVAGLLVAGVWVAKQRMDAARERVLAVMPLRNASPDKEETAYIAEGLGQELVRRLNGAGGFRILPWATTSAFASTERTPQALAHELRADVMLMGSFNGEGERIQVLVELVDGRTGLQLWSDRVVRTTGDLIGLQTAIATSVAEHVARRRDADRAKRVAQTSPSSPEAYELYLRGATYLQADDEREKTLALPLFTRAVELDPGLAVAWVGLGAVYTDRRFLGGEGGESNLSNADSCFQRALGLAPGLPEAARGLISLSAETGKSDLALQLASAALQGHTRDLDALVTAGWGLTLGGLPELAVPVLDRALELDSNNQSASWYRVLALCWSADFRRCVEAGRTYVRRFGEDQEIYMHMAVALTATGNRNQALVFAQRAVELSPTPRYAPLILAGLLTMTGKAQAAEVFLDSTIIQFREYVDAFPDNWRVRGYLAVLNTYRGNLAERDAEVARIVRYLAGGGTSTGGSEPDIPFAAALVGDLDGAKRFATQLPISDALWGGWGTDVTWAEHGAAFAGGETPQFLRSAEYASIRHQVDAHRERRLKQYRPLVDQALRR